MLKENAVRTLPSAVRILSVPFFLVACIMAAFSSAYGAEPEFTIITTAQLKAMVDENKEMTLIDARTKEEYREAHIAGAINIPEKSFDEDIQLLSADKKALLVFYCNGVKCGKSKKAALKAVARGYKKVLVYGEGFPVWEAKGLKIVPGPDYAKKIETTKMTPAEIKKLIEEKNTEYVLVDVRDEAEYKEGHIPTALNIPVEIFASTPDALPKKKRIIVYCNTGGRSYTAYRKLMKLAYPNIAQAYFAEWKDGGMAVEK